MANDLVLVGAALDLLGAGLLSVPALLSADRKRRFFTAVPFVGIVYEALDRLNEDGELDRRTEADLIGAVYPFVARVYDFDEGVDPIEIRVGEDWIEVEQWAGDVQTRRGIDAPLDRVEFALQRIERRVFAGAGLAAIGVGTAVLIVGAI